jgi:hypothetical protein
MAKQMKKVGCVSSTIIAHIHHCHDITHIYTAESAVKRSAISAFPPAIRTTQRGDNDDVLLVNLIGIEPKPLSRILVFYSRHGYQFKSEIRCNRCQGDADYKMLVLEHHSQQNK